MHEPSRLPSPPGSPHDHPPRGEKNARQTWMLVEAIVGSGGDDSGKGPVAWGPHPFGRPLMRSLYVWPLPQVGAFPNGPPLANHHLVRVR